MNNVSCFFFVYDILSQVLSNYFRYSNRLEIIIEDKCTAVFCMQQQLPV